MFLLYHLFVTITLIILFPVLYPVKNRLCLRERFGLGLPDMGQPVQKRLWVHALSVGEVLSSIPLLEALKREYPSRELTLSVKTATGLKIAKQRLQGVADYIVPMSLDFWWSSRKMANAIQPALFILVETDIWPGLMALLKKRGVKTILVNGRISPRTAKSYAKYRLFMRRVLNELELCLVQTEIDRSRIRAGGLPSGRIKVTGNIKFDISSTSMSRTAQQKTRAVLGLKNRIVWIAGSTHHPEEESIIKVFGELVRSFPDLALILAPRDVKRFEDVYKLVQEGGFNVIRRTELPAEKNGYTIIILNTLGELGQIYGVSDVAFVGGSLVEKGGHNLLEPASFGIPVLFGPHMYNFVTMSRLLISKGGGRAVADESELLRNMKELLGDKQERERMGKKAQEFVKQNRGAHDRVMKILKPYLEDFK
ncbi:MAG: 3-deoxy-D-manno-octulosonic acid transferase [Thermodesulfobacteriota bacterium]